MKNEMSLKAKIKNMAKNKGISSQAILQNYLMNRFLYRLSVSQYKEKFVVKGGMLISSIVGIAHRSTMDLDTTLLNLPLTELSIKEAFEDICQVDTNDGITFNFGSIGSIRKDDLYGGYRVSFFARYGKINAPMSMDISTGDIITPGAEKHVFFDMFDEGIYFELWSYPIETVLAEKVETILSRGIENTRPRDYYDVYMISGLNYDPLVFKQAFSLTAKHRDSIDKIADYNAIIQKISKDVEMNRRWHQYSKQMPYASNITFNDTLLALESVLSSLTINRERSDK